MKQASIRILLVEDDADVVGMYVSRGLVDGIEFVVTANGDEAIRLVEKEQFAAAVVDLEIDGHNQGDDVIRAIRAMCKDTIIVVTTRSESDTRRNNNLKDGAVVFLRKPILYPDLKVQLDALLRLKMDIDPVLTAGPVTYNTATHFLFCGDKEPEHLTGLEAAVFEHLMRRRNRPQTLAMLYAGATGEDSRSMIRSSMTRMIAELRKKLLAFCGDEIIRTHSVREQFDGKETTYVIPSPI